MFDFLEIEKPLNKSFLSRIHPILKLQSLILIYILVFKFNSITLNIAIFILLILIAIMNKPDYKILKKGMLLAFYLFFFYTIFILFLFSNPSEGINLWIIHLSTHTIKILLNIFIRISLLAFSTIVYIMFTGTQYIVYSIEDIFYPLTFLKIPVKIISMILFLILGFIPMLLEEMNNIRKSQEVRGISFRNKNIFLNLKFVISIIIPLLILIFNRSETLSNAMTLKQYNPFKQSSRFSTYKTTKLNIAEIIIFLPFIGFILFI